MELHVRAVSARNLIDKQTFGKQDPYCKISVRNKTFRTRVHDNGDRTPVWNEKFVFEVYDPQLEQLHIQVKDKNFTASVLIGEVRLPINMFLHGNVVDQWYTLNNGSRRAGEINLRIQLCGAGMKPSKAPPAQAYPYATSAPPGYPTAQAYPAPQPPQQQQQMYQQQQWQIQQQQQQIVQQQQQIAQQQAQLHANAQYAAPPPRTMMVPAYPAPPPPMMMAPAPPPVVMAPTPVMMAPAAPGVVYGAPPPVYGAAPPGYHHHRRGRYGGGDGIGGGEIAMGVGAGVLGGMLLGEVLGDGLFD